MVQAGFHNVGNHLVITNILNKRERTARFIYTRAVKVAAQQSVVAALPQFEGHRWILSVSAVSVVFGCRWAHILLRYLSPFCLALLFKYRTLHKL
jgi:hypothetical protein